MVLIKESVERPTTSPDIQYELCAERGQDPFRKNQAAYVPTLDE